MKTTLAIKKDLLQEAKLLANVKTKNAAVEKALEEFVSKPLLYYQLKNKGIISDYEFLHDSIDSWPPREMLAAILLLSSPGSGEYMD